MAEFMSAGKFKGHQIFFSQATPFILTAPSELAEQHFPVFYTWGREVEENEMIHPSF